MKTTKSMSNTSTISTIKPTLIPIRIDVLTDDRLLRVVDTVLIDPTCWPIPLGAPLHETVERNVTYLAHTILSDAEVQGMSRTVRHFTGRVDIWTPQLQEKVEDQLRPQIWKIINGRAKTIDDKCSGKDKHLIPISIRFILNRISVYEDILWDPYGPVTPIEFAHDMTKELNLPEEATVSIVTTMLEQLYGLAMDESSNPTVDYLLEKDKRGAWLLDATAKVHTETQVVAHHK
jgi:hypothetical protein